MHVTMEHPPIVKFIQWNFTGDAEVNDIGSLLAPTTVAVPVPSS